MASNLVDIIDGATVAWGTTGWTAQVTEIQPPGLTRGSEDAGHLATAGARPQIAHDTYVWDDMEMTVHFNPDDEIGGAGALKLPMGEAPEVITLTFLGPDDLAGSAWAITGFMSSYKPQKHGLGGIMMADVTITVTVSSISSQT